MKILFALVVALMVALIPLAVGAQDLGPPDGGSYYDILKNPLTLRKFILDPVGLGVVGGLSSLILSEIAWFKGLEDKNKRLVSAGAAIVLALLVYGMSYIPPKVWNDVSFLWYAVLGYGFLFFGQKFTYRVFVKTPPQGKSIE